MRAQWRCDNVRRGLRVGLAYHMSDFQQMKATPRGEKATMVLQRKSWLDSTYQSIPCDRITEISIDCSGTRTNSQKQSNIHSTMHSTTTRASL
jgi:hypothetical protein